MLETPFSLKDKKIFVTGASSGLGKEISIQCSKFGADVIITGRNQNKLQETLALLDTKLTNKIITADLSDDQDLDFIIDSLPNLDGLILNAGIVKTVPVSFIKKEHLKEVFDVNFNSSVYLIQKLLKNKKIKKGGSICFISSVASSYVNKGNSLYSASKGAINSFTKALALELARKKIRVNAILPGFIETKILDKSNLEEESITRHLEKYPLGRFGKPSDIAYAAIYLMADVSQWTTGSLMTVDGGYSII